MHHMTLLIAHSERLYVVDRRRSHDDERMSTGTSRNRKGARCGYYAHSKQKEAIYPTRNNVPLARTKTHSGDPGYSASPRPPPLLLLLPSSPRRRRPSRLRRLRSRPPHCRCGRWHTHPVCEWDHQTVRSVTRILTYFW